MQKQKFCDCWYCIFCFCLILIIIVLFRTSAKSWTRMLLCRPQYHLTTPTISWVCPNQNVGLCPNKLDGYVQTIYDGYIQDNKPVGYIRIWHILYTLQMKGQWESNINVWFPFMYSRKWHCYFPNRIIMFCLPVPLLIYQREIYTFLLHGNIGTNPGIIYIAHRLMKVEIGTEAAQFPV